MKIALLAATFLSFFAQSAISEPSGASEREWKQRLSPSRFAMGSSRVETEKRLQGKTIGEKETDHGFDVLLDVYYELDAAWCARVCYSRRDGKLVVQPQLLAFTPELRERLTKSPPKSR